jgi:hypothetical protein
MLDLTAKVLENREDDCMIVAKTKESKDLISEKLSLFNLNLKNSSENAKQLYGYTKLIKQQQSELVITAEELPYIFGED